MPDALEARLAAARLDWLVPDWRMVQRVRAFSTTRNGVGGEAADLSRKRDDVSATRVQLRALLPAEPVWLAQVHGASVCDADSAGTTAPRADAAISRTAGTVCAVLSADCLPVLFADRGGSVVAVAHAGWRGLAAGVLEATVDAMRVAPATVVAWLGPAIGPEAFQVGADVLDAFCADDPGAKACFVADSEGKWRADLYSLARQRLARAGVATVCGGGRCTYTESGAFYSYRRGDKDASARMATLIWIDPA